jgi:hypothetical protein
MWERIVGKVGERNGNLERTREWMGRYEVEVEGGWWGRGNNRKED